MARDVTAKKHTRDVRVAKAEAPPKPRPRNERVSPTDVTPRKTIPRVRLRDRVRAFASRLMALALRLRQPGLYLLRTLAVLLTLGGAVAVGRLLQNHLTSSKAFAIDRVDIQGLIRIEREELLEAAGVDVGTNIFARSPEQVQARLLRHPWVAAASVARRLPSELSIRIREREAMALLVLEPCETFDISAASAGCEEPSSLYLVSDEGSLFKRLTGEDPVDLPVMTGVARERFGSDLAYRQRVLLRTVSLLQQMRDLGLQKRVPVGEIHIEVDDGISLYVGEQLTHVRLGNPPYEDKLGRMKQVFERLEREQTSAEYVYLDNEKRPDRVTVRLR